MSSNELMKFNWLSTDLRDPDLKNFLVLFAKHLQKNNVYLIPNGFILKQPEEFITEKSNTVIDIIGVPFRNVVGRRKFYYNRIYLSAFYNKHKFKMGTRNRPLQLNYTGDDNSYLNAIKKRIASVTNTQEDLFKLEIEELIPHSNVRRIKIKFNIKPLEFKTEESGLSLYNDSNVYIYVKDRTVNPVGLLTRIAEESYIDVNLYNYESFSSAIGTFSFDELTSKNRALPEYLKLIPNGYREDVSWVESGDFNHAVERYIINYSIPVDVDIHTISLNYDGPEIKYSINEGERSLSIYVSENDKREIAVGYHSYDLKDKILIDYIIPMLSVGNIDFSSVKYAYTRIRSDIDNYSSSSSVRDITRRIPGVSYLNEIETRITPPLLDSVAGLSRYKDINIQKIKYKTAINISSTITSSLSNVVGFSSVRF